MNKYIISQEALNRLLNAADFLRLDVKEEVEIIELKHELLKYQNLVGSMGKELEKVKGMKEACERKLYEKKEHPESAMLQLHMMRYTPEYHELYEAFKKIADQNLIGEFLRRYEREKRNM